jgi:adenylate cyclase
MADEIERKFLVKSADWRSAVSGSKTIKQGYMAVNDQCAVRVRIADNEAYLTIKSSGLAIARKEYEYDIPLADAEEMMRQFCTRHRIEKVRYFVDYRDCVWEVDVFEGDNQGLVVAEIELRSVDEEVPLPPWAGLEVSGDARYMNNNLASHPYTNWSATGHTE